MKVDLSGITPILDTFSEPILLLREGRVSYRNAAAAALFSDIEVAAPYPQPLESVLHIHETDGVATCSIAGKDYTVTSTVIPEGVIMVMRNLQQKSRRECLWARTFTEQVRQQMTGLLAVTQQLEEELREKSDDQYDKWMAMLNQNAYRMLRMTRAAELEQRLTNEIAYHPAMLDLTELCYALHGEVAPLAKQMGMTFSCEMQRTPILTTGDASLLRTMLLALISNAMKAVQTGGTIGLRLVPRNGRAVLTIWDNGAGMDERSLGTIFQEENASTVPRPGEGLRLGLINARNIAMLHYGVTVVVSRHTEGARFTVSLPIKTPEGLPLRTPKRRFDSDGGFSSLLVELSDALPWQVYLQAERE